MKLAHVVFPVALACCGQVAPGGAGATDSGAPIDAREPHDAGTFAKDSGAPDDGALLPAVGTAACTMFDGNCVFCDDDKWHCVDFVFPQCPSSIASNDSCPDVVDGGPCIDCESDGAATEWECGSNGRWLMFVRNSCTQKGAETVVVDSGGSRMPP
jgi:hypothetical protein